MMEFEPRKWVPPDFGDSPVKKFVEAGNARSSRIDSIIKTEAGSPATLIQRARLMFVNARAQGDDRVTTEWAIIGVALASTVYEDTSSYD